MSFVDQRVLQVINGEDQRSRDSGKSFKNDANIKKSMQTLDLFQGSLMLVVQRPILPKARDIVTENRSPRYPETTMLVLHTTVKEGLSHQSNSAWTLLRYITEIGSKGKNIFYHALL